MPKIDKNGQIEKTPFLGIRDKHGFLEENGRNRKTQKKPIYTNSWILEICQIQWDIEKNGVFRDTPKLERGYV